MKEVIIEVYGTTRLRLAVHMSRGRGRKVGFDLVCKVPLVRHTGGNRGKQLSPQLSQRLIRLKKGGGEKERELC